MGVVGTAVVVVLVVVLVAVAAGLFDPVSFQCVCVVAGGWVVVAVGEWMDALVGGGGGWCWSWAVLVVLWVGWVQVGVHAA